MAVKNVALELVQPNEWNPNIMDAETLEDLKADVVAGFYNPVVVTPLNVYHGDPELASDQYVIVDGENRWRAAVEADIGYLDVDVKPLTESEARLYCYRMNKVKGTIDPLREGDFFNLEVEVHGSEEAVAERYNRTRSYVAGRRSLTRVSESVQRLYKDPSDGFLELKKEQIAADIAEANPEEDYTEEQMAEMVEVTLEQDDIVPRGTVTASHLEALVVLPKEGPRGGVQAQVAAKVIEEDLNVKDTVIVVKMVRANLARRTRFENVLKDAVQKTCPECGAAPRDFDSGYMAGDYRYDRFVCSRSSWHDWEFAVDAAKEAARKTKYELERDKDKSDAAREARVNPAYIRRVEVTETLTKSVAPWILEQLATLSEIKSVTVLGRREDGKRLSLEWPTRYGSGLTYRLTEIEEGEHSPYAVIGKSLIRFGYSTERKEYKTLPFKTKVDLDQGGSPEARALGQFFFDTIVNTTLDPALPEDPDERKKILGQYGELDELEAST